MSDMIMLPYAPYQEVDTNALTQACVRNLV